MNVISISLLLEKRSTFNNVKFFIKSVFKKDKNNHYYSIFLENGSYQLPKSNDNKLVFI